MWTTRHNHKKAACDTRLVSSSWIYSYCGMLLWYQMLLVWITSMAAISWITTIIAIIAILVISIPLTVDTIPDYTIEYYWRAPVDIDTHARRHSCALIHRHTYKHVWKIYHYYLSSSNTYSTCSRDVISSHDYDYNIIVSYVLFCHSLRFTFHYNFYHESPTIVLPQPVGRSITAAIHRHHSYM